MASAKVCEGGAGLHPLGGAEGGAKVAVCEGISRGSQPKDRASSVFPATGYFADRAVMNSMTARSAFCIRPRQGVVATVGMLLRAWRHDKSLRLVA